MDRQEDALKKVIKLIENGSAEKEGRKARRFVEKRSWDSITDEFEGIFEVGDKVLLPYNVSGVYLNYDYFFIYTQR